MFNIKKKSNIIYKMKNLMNIFIIAVLIYFILYYVPSKKLPNKDILIVITIIFSVFLGDNIQS